MTILHATMGRSTSSPADTVLDALMSSQVVDESSPCGAFTKAGRIGCIYASEPVNRPESRKVLAWKQSLLKTLNPFIGGDGLIRVGSRILRANAKEDAKTPIVLPRHDRIFRHRVTALRIYTV